MAVATSRSVTVRVDADTAQAVSAFEEVGDAAEGSADAVEAANERTATSAEDAAARQAESAAKAAEASEASADAQGDAAEEAADRSTAAAEKSAAAQGDAAEEAAARVTAAANEAADAQEEASARTVTVVTDAGAIIVDEADEAAARQIAAANKAADAYAAAAERAAKTASAESDAAAQAMADGDEVAYERAAKASEVAAARAQAAWEKSAAASTKATAAASDIEDEESSASAAKIAESSELAAARARTAWEASAVASARATELGAVESEASVAKFGDAADAAGSRVSGVFSKLGSSLGALGIPFAGSFEKMAKSIDNADTKGQKFAATMSSVGKVVTATGVIGFAAAAAESLHMAGNFQQLTNMLVTSAGTTEAQLGAVRKGILDISVQTDTSSTQLAEGMYHISSAGYTGAEGLNVLKAAAEGAKAEGADLDTVGKALAGTMNDWHVAGSGATSMMNQMLATVAAGDLRMQDLASSLGNVGPLAAKAGLSYAQVGGAVATMTSQNMTAQRATQDLNNLIRGIQAPSTTAVSEMQQLGLNSNELSKNLGKEGLTGTLQTMVGAITEHMGPAGEVILDAFKKSQAAGSDLKEMLDNMSPSIRKLADQFMAGKLSLSEFRKEIPTGAGGAQLQEFTALYDKTKAFNDAIKAGQPGAQTFTNALKAMTGGATGMNVAMMLTGANAQTFADNVKKIGDAAQHTGANVDNWKVIQSNFNFQLGQAKEEAEKLGIELGDALMPKVQELMHATMGVVSWFQKHTEAAKVLAGVVGGVLATAVGVMAFNALRKFASGVKSAYDDVTKLAGAMAKAGSWGMRKIGFTEEGSNPVTSAAPAATEDEGAAAAVEASQAQQTAAVAEGTAERTSMVEEAAAAQTEAITTGAEASAAAMDASSAEMDAAIGTTDAVEDANPLLDILGAVALAATLLATHWKAIWGGIKEVFGDVVGFLKDHINAIKAALPVLLGPLGLIIDGVIELGEHWRAVWNAISSVVSTAVDFVKDHLHDIELGLEILGGPIALLATHWHETWSDITSAVSTAVDAVTGTVNDLATGLSTAWSAIKSAASTVWNGVLSFLQTTWSTIKSTVLTAVNTVEGDLQAGWNTITGAVHTAWTSIEGFFQSTWDSLKSTVSSGISSIVNWLTGLPQQAMTAVNDLDNDLEGFFTKVMNDAYGSMTTAAGQIFSWFNGLGTSVVNAAGDVFSDVESIGTSIINGIVAGIKGAAGDIWKAIKSALPGGGVIGKALGAIGLTATATTKLTKTMLDDGKDAENDLNVGLQKPITDLKTYVNDAKNEIDKSFGGTFLEGTVNALAQQFDNLADKGAGSLASIQSKLASAQSALASIKQQIASSASSLESSDGSAIPPSQSSSGVAIPITGKYIVSNLQQELANMKKFRQLLDTLKGWGLNESVMSQLVAAGPTDGLPTAEALVAGGKKLVNQVDDLQSQINSNATAIAADSAQAEVDGKEVGEKQAEGIISGLQAQEKKVESEMTKLAEKMKKAIGQAVNGRKVGESLIEAMAAGVKANTGVLTKAFAQAAQQGTAAAVSAASGGNGSRAGGGQVVNFSPSMTVNVAGSADKATIGLIKKEMQTFERRIVREFASV